MEIRLTLNLPKRKSSEQLPEYHLNRKYKFENRELKYFIKYINIKGDKWSQKEMIATANFDVLGVGFEPTLARRPFLEGNYLTHLIN